MPVLAEQGSRNMPKWLGLLTLVGLATPIMALTKPFSGVGVLGEQISFRTWFCEASGWVFIVPAFILGWSLILNIRRSRLARPVHISGWVAMVAGAYLGIRLTGKSPPMFEEGLVFLLAVTCCVAAYLYLNRDVRRYFG